MPQQLIPQGQNHDSQVGASSAHGIVVQMAQRPSNFREENNRLDPHDLLASVRQRDVSMLAVYADQVELLDLPPPHLPRLVHARAIRTQFAVGDAFSRQFVFNLPTHYLCFTPILQRLHRQSSQRWVALPILEQALRQDYPVLPNGLRSFRAALAGNAGNTHVAGTLLAERNHLRFNINGYHTPKKGRHWKRDPPQAASQINQHPVASRASSAV